MNLYIIVLTTLAILFSITIVEAYAEEQQGGIHLDRSLGVTGFHQSVRIDSSVTVTDYESFKNIIDETGSARILGGSPIVIHDSMLPRPDIEGRETFDMAAFSTGYFASLFQIGSLKDEGSAPSMSGWNTKDSHRVTFDNVFGNPIFKMSNTEISMLNVKAIERYVPVYFDGVLIYTIDNGRPPSGDYHEKWLDVGSVTAKIPFEAYYSVSDTGHHNHHGEGYQHIKTDLVGNKTFEDYDD